ncbi:MAG: DMT family transporter [Candidatus Carbobacillus altaicus]|nr:DMT family transporter [Candidatus Carbobacillus altaicus]
MPWLFLVATFIAGILISVQGITNTIGSRLISLPMMVLTLSFVQTIPPLIWLFKHLPSLGWWHALTHGARFYIVSGLIGVYVVSTLSLAVGRIGSLTAFVVVILGQIIGGAIIDHFGLLGADVRPITWVKLISIILILSGVILLFYGEQQPPTPLSHE